MKSNGFTLVEALVSLTLLTVALVPAFYQATQAVSLSLTVRNSMTASNLAVEGVEVVRAVRDANWFAGSPFAQGLDSCAPASGGCRVEYDSTAVLPLSGNAPLRYDLINGLYQYAAGDDSDFSRRITIEQITPKELQVVSEVSWTERNIDKTFAIEYHLYDWLK
jgi:Tfp pilus assembly protein PilV